MPDTISRLGVCVNQSCEFFGEVTWCKVNKFGTPVCCECEGDDVFDEDGFPFKTRDFEYQL